MLTVHVLTMHVLTVCVLTARVLAAAPVESPQCGRPVPPALGGLQRGPAAQPAVTGHGAAAAQPLPLRQRLQQQGRLPAPALRGQ